MKGTWLAGTPDPQAFADALAAAAPKRAEGTDRSGAIRVVVGADGLPESVRVESNWRRILGSGAFAAAVVEACTAATVARGEATVAVLGRLEQPGRWMPAGPAETVESTRSTGELPPELAELPKPIRRRDVDAVVADVLNIAQPVDSETADEPIGTGSAARGRLEVTVTEIGTVTCVADPRWVAEREAGELSDALRDAFGRARAELRAAVEAAYAEPEQFAQLDGLLGEVVQLLYDVPGR